MRIDQEDFWAHAIADDSGCLLWQGNLNPHRYGRYRKGPAGAAFSMLAHRVAYILTKGPIPDGLCVCHSCDVPSCVEPEHLWLGTRAENTRDRDLKGRAAWADRNGRRIHPERTRRGERHPCARLTDVQVSEIRHRYVKGDRSVGSRGLARSFGVSHPTIWHIVNGRSRRGDCGVARA
jgi:hypothetical protein